MTRITTHGFRKAITSSARDESGSATILSLFFLMIVIVMGGIAVDFSKAIADRTHLQVTADTAAHAALYAREQESRTAAVQVAMETVDNMLPSTGFGSHPIVETDIEFGVWDPDTLNFVRMDSSRDAVRVTAQMTEERGNPARNLLLSIIGWDTFDIAVQSVYTTYYPPCFTEGFVADEVVDVQSNNAFGDYFCVHSNDHVSMNQNNYFGAGSWVSMPDSSNLDVPASAFEQNSGLDGALRTDVYRLRLLNQLPDIIESFWSGHSRHLPPYVAQGDVYFASTSQLAVEPPEGEQVNGNSFTPYHFAPNRVNVADCPGNGKIKISSGTYSSFLLITNCTVDFSSDVVLEDVVIATTNPSTTSFSASAGLTIGRVDNCAPGGGATLMTLGGVRFPASVSANGGQILAIKDIQFNAQATGEGVSFVSKGRIDGTSNMSMGYCNTEGMEDAYRATYFRMVQ